MNKEQLLKKLRLEPEHVVLIVNAPKEYQSLLGTLKYDTKPLKTDAGKYDFIQLFATTQTQLEKLTAQCAKAGKYNCLFWACFPKGGGHIKSDIRRDTVWNAFEKVGLRPVSEIAIDETWSALRARPHEMVGVATE
jgi:hypothetical protein